MVKHLAAVYYSHFYFSSQAGQLRLTLSSYAPLALKDLVQDVLGPDPDQALLSCLYECLCTLAGEEALVDPEDCPDDLYHTVKDYLESLAPRL
jgi:hypothetical protein